MYYLIVGVGGDEQVLCTGSQHKLESLAKKLRKEAFFRWVRVDRTPPRGLKGAHHRRSVKPKKP